MRNRRENGGGGGGGERGVVFSSLVDGVPLFPVGVKHRSSYGLIEGAPKEEGTLLTVVWPW